MKKDGKELFELNDLEISIHGTKLSGFVESIENEIEKFISVSEKDIEIGHYLGGARIYIKRNKIQRGKIITVKNEYHADQIYSCPHFVLYLSEKGSLIKVGK